MQYILNINSIEMLFPVINSYKLSDHVPEKIFQIGQAIHKLWTYFNLQVRITQ